MGAHQESVGYNTTVNIQNRPITNHGVGLKMKGLGSFSLMVRRSQSLLRQDLLLDEAEGEKPRTLQRDREAQTGG